MAAAAGEKTSFDAATAGLATARKQQPELQVQVDKLATTLQAIHDLTGRAAQFGVRDQNDQAMALLAKADQISTGFVADIKSLNDTGFATVNKRNDEQTATDDSSSTMMLIMSVVGILGGIGIAFLVTRSGITGPLSRLQTQMGEIAAADFKRDVEGTDRGDEVGAMAKAVRVVPRERDRQAGGGRGEGAG